MSSRWVSIDPDLLAVAPAAPACYVVYIDGRLGYIGQTNNLRRRMAGHGIDISRYSDSYRTPWGTARQIHIKANFGVRFGDWAMRELRLIRRLRPHLNCVGSTKVRGTA